jgi:hypothetical protein
MERSEILANYRAWMAALWGKGRLGVNEVLENIRSLKVFIEVHRLSLEEHEAAADAAGLDRRELIDANNQALADWLAARRRPLAPGSGALHYALPARPAPWKQHLPPPPATWQNIGAGLAAFGLVVAVALVVAAVAINFIP